MRLFRLSRPPYPGSPFALLALIAAIVTACGPAAIAVSSIGPSATAIPPAVSASASMAPPAATAPLGPALPTIAPEAIIAIDQPAQLAFDGTTIWVFSSTGEISRIDPTKNASGAPVMVAPGWTWGGFGKNAAGLWLGDYDANLVYRIDPASLAIVAKVPVAANPDGVGVTVDAVWVAQHRGGSVTRIDAATNAAKTVAFGNRGPGGPHEIGFGAGSVWVSAGSSTDSGGGGAVVRIDAVTNDVQATIPMPAGASACGGFAISDDAVWMNSCFDQAVLVRIDPRTNTVVATIALGGYGGAPVLIDGVPWLTVKQTDGGLDPARLVRIDPASNTIDRIVSLGEAYTGERFLLAGDSLWTADWPNNQVLRFLLAALKP